MTRIKKSFSVIFPTFSSLFSHLIFHGVLNVPRGFAHPSERRLNDVTSASARRERERRRRKRRSGEETAHALDERRRVAESLHVLIIVQACRDFVFNGVVLKLKGGEANDVER